MAYLTIKSLKVFYEKALALNDISIDISKGELVAIIGPNGAGKSTLLRAISALVPIEGEIFFDGEPLQTKKPHEIVKNGIIHCPERRQLFEDFTVFENLIMGAFLRKDKEKIQRDIDYICDLFPIFKERRKQQAGSLSGGQQQMVAIGRSLMSKPKILMMDEPFMGLSPLVKKNLANSIIDIWKSGITILLVEQDAHLAINISERIYIIENGKIRLSGKSSNLLNNEDIKKAYFM